MHGPLINNSAKRKQKKREAARRRKAAQRKRKRNEIVCFPGRCSQAVIAAIIARNIYLGLMTKEEAEKQIKNPKKISVEVFGILEHWWPHWYAATK